MKKDDCGGPRLVEARPTLELGQIERVRFLSPRLSRKSGAVEHQRRQQRIGCDWFQPCGGCEDRVAATWSR